MTSIVEDIMSMVRPYSTLILVAIAIIIFALASYYGYHKFAKSILKTDETKDVANANRRNKVADLYFFHVDWCPHCRTAMPVWNSFADDYNGREINGVTVKCHTINCTDEDDPKVTDKVNMYDIQSYPTVKLVLGDGTVVEFDAKIERESLSDFLDTVLKDK
jgi:thiol-disulfide isomerase/thioredoxin